MFSNVNVTMIVQLCRKIAFSVLLVDYVFYRLIFIDLCTGRKRQRSQSEDDTVLNIITRYSYNSCGITIVYDLLKYTVHW